MWRSLMTWMLVASLSIGGALDAFAQSSPHKHKSKKPKSPSCQTGCKTDTSVPQVAVDTPQEEAAQKELSELARALHSATPGAYERLAAFAGKNTTNIWGARAALALGYDDYARNRAAQGLGWLLKGQNDTLLRCYALYWTAQCLPALARYSASDNV